MTSVALCATKGTAPPAHTPRPAHTPHPAHTHPAHHREDPNVPKAYFRRGVAHGWLGHYGEAAGDLSAVMELDPSLKGEVMQELARMREREKKGEAQQRAEMTSFFDRVRGT